MRVYMPGKLGVLFLIDEYQGEPDSPKRTRTVASLPTRTLTEVIAGELNTAYQAGLSDAPVIIGAKIDGHVIIAAIPVPDHDALWAVAGFNPSRERPFVTWMAQGCQDGEVMFLNGSDGKTTLAVAVDDMLSRAGLLPEQNV